MSYSRWGHSSWYVFWNTSSGKDMDSQVLSAWYSLDKCIDWTYEEVMKLFSNLPFKAESIISSLQMKYECSADEANELQELMQVWVADVKKEFPLL